ncbi:MAG: multicopper oxidase domain-containing protein [Verrucomicrobia bacterium]|nr:multicopper oxidase domain-containing protein [Verrucomicrobiota bacterium]
MLPGASTRARAQLPGGTLDPTHIPKYRMPLFTLPSMPRSGQIRGVDGRRIDYYEIAVRQFRQRILPPGLPATTVWSYGSLRAPGTPAQGGSFSYPSFTIEARSERPVRVKWINDLKDRAGRYLPHLLPVDQTLHWANPPGPRDHHTMDPTRYAGPVPIVTHLHGGHSGDESDGYPEAWYLPAASNLPAGAFAEGTWYEYFKNQARVRHGMEWEPGSATFQYPNDQAATTLWFHDHSLGIVRQNVYAGPAGFYLLRGGPGDQVDGRLPGSRPGADDDERPRGGREAHERGPSHAPYEIPLIIQDRSFNADGSLFYPDSRAFFDGFTGPYVPESDIAPIWNAEFFGNTIVVNGRTWPYLQVERRRYRFRVLNACNSRFLILKMDTGLPFWQIGSDGGFLTQPAGLDQLLLAPAERADVIVDFSQVRPGTRLTLLNLAPDEPFGGGAPGTDFAPADPDTTGQVMQFRVVAASGPDPSTPPDRLVLPAPPQLGTTNAVRHLSFNELDSEVLAGVGPRIGLLGLADLTNPVQPAGVPLRWMDDVTETPIAGTTEVWEIFDITEDAHPMHVHQVQFEILNREVFDPASPDQGQVFAPEAGETGRKDTVVLYPGMITRVKAHFDLAGRYVWHCHILEHEDNEMMRPLQVMPA